MEGLKIARDMEHTKKNSQHFVLARNGDNSNILLKEIMNEKEESFISNINQYSPNGDMSINSSYSLNFQRKRKKDVNFSLGSGILANTNEKDFNEARTPLNITGVLNQNFQATPYHIGRNNHFSSMNKKGLSNMINPTNSLSQPSIADIIRIKLSAVENSKCVNKRIRNKPKKKNAVNSKKLIVETKKLLVKTKSRKDVKKHDDPKTRVGKRERKKTNFFHFEGVSFLPKKHENVVNTNAVNLERNSQSACNLPILNEDRVSRNENFARLDGNTCEKLQSNNNFNPQSSTQLAISINNLPKIYECKKIDSENISVADNARTGENHFKEKIPSKTSMIVDKKADKMPPSQSVYEVQTSDHAALDTSKINDTLQNVSKPKSTTTQKTTKAAPKKKNRTYGRKRVKNKQCRPYNLGSSDFDDESYQAESYEKKSKTCKSLNSCRNEKKSMSKRKNFRKKRQMKKNDHKSCSETANINNAHLKAHDLKMELFSEMPLPNNTINNQMDMKNEKINKVPHVQLKGLLTNHDAIQPCNNICSERGPQEKTRKILSMQTSAIEKKLSFDTDDTSSESDGDMYEDDKTTRDEILKRGTIPNQKSRLGKMYNHIVSIPVPVLIPPIPLHRIVKCLPFFDASKVYDDYHTRINEESYNFLYPPETSISGFDIQVIYLSMKAKTSAGDYDGAKLFCKNIINKWTLKVKEVKNQKNSNIDTNMESMAQAVGGLWCVLAHFILDVKNRSLQNYSRIQNNRNNKKRKVSRQVQNRNQNVFLKANCKNLRRTNLMATLRAAMEAESILAEAILCPIARGVAWVWIAKSRLSEHRALIEATVSSALLSIPCEKIESNEQSLRKRQDIALDILRQAIRNSRAICKEGMFLPTTREKEKLSLKNKTSSDDTFKNCRTSPKAKTAGVFDLRGRKYICYELNRLCDRELLLNINMDDSSIRNKNFDKSKKKEMLRPKNRNHFYSSSMSVEVSSSANKSNLNPICAKANHDNAFLTASYSQNSVGVKHLSASYPSLLDNNNKFEIGKNDDNKQSALAENVKSNKKKSDHIKQSIFLESSESDRKISVGIKQRMLMEKVECDDYKQRTLVNNIKLYGKIRDDIQKNALIDVIQSDEKNSKQITVLDDIESDEINGDSVKQIALAESTESDEKNTDDLKQNTFVDNIKSVGKSNDYKKSTLVDIIECKGKHSDGVKQITFMYNMECDGKNSDDMKQSTLVENSELDRKKSDCIKQSTRMEGIKSDEKNSGSIKQSTFVKNADLDGKNSDSIKESNLMEDMKSDEKIHDDIKQSTFVEYSELDEKNIDYIKQNAPWEESKYDGKNSYDIKQNTLLDNMEYDGKKNNNIKQSIFMDNSEVDGKISNDIKENSLVDNKDLHEKNTNDNKQSTLVDDIECIGKYSDSVKQSTFVDNTECDGKNSDDIKQSTLMENSEIDRKKSDGIKQSPRMENIKRDGRNSDNIKRNASVENADLDERKSYVVEQSTLLEYSKCDIKNSDDVKQNILVENMEFDGKNSVDHKQNALVDNIEFDEKKIDGIKQTTLMKIIKSDGKNSGDYKQSILVENTEKKRNDLKRKTLLENSDCDGKTSDFVAQSTLVDNTKFEEKNSDDYKQSTPVYNIELDEKNINDIKESTVTNIKKSDKKYRDDIKESNLVDNIEFDEKNSDGINHSVLIDGKNSNYYTLCNFVQNTKSNEKKGDGIKQRTFVENTQSDEEVFDDCKQSIFLDDLELNEKNSNDYKQITPENSGDIKESILRENIELDERNSDCIKQSTLVENIEYALLGKNRALEEQFTNTVTAAMNSDQKSKICDKQICHEKKKVNPSVLHLDCLKTDKNDKIDTKSSKRSVCTLLTNFAPLSMSTEKQIHPLSLKKAHSQSPKTSHISELCMDLRKKNLISFDTGTTRRVILSSASDLSNTCCTQIDLNVPNKAAYEEISELSDEKSADSYRSERQNVKQISLESSNSKKISIAVKDKKMCSSSNIDCKVVTNSQLSVQNSCNINWFNPDKNAKDSESYVKIQTQKSSFPKNISHQIFESYEPSEVSTIAQTDIRGQIEIAYNMKDILKSSTSCMSCGGKLKIAVQKNRKSKKRSKEISQLPTFHSICCDCKDVNCSSLISSNDYHPMSKHREYMSDPRFEPGNLGIAPIYFDLNWCCHTCHKIFTNFDDFRTHKPCPSKICSMGTLQEI